MLDKSPGVSKDSRSWPTCRFRLAGFRHTSSAKNVTSISSESEDDEVGLLTAVGYCLVIEQIMRPTCVIHNPCGNVVVY